VQAGAFRIVGMPAFASQLATGAGQGAHGPTATRAILASTSSAPWQLSVPADTDVQTEVIFAPKFDLFTMLAGPKSAKLHLTGSGVNGAWAVDVPVDGTFNGLQVGVVFVIDDREITVTVADSIGAVPVTLTGVGQSETGTIRGGAVPAWVSVGQVQATVPATSSVKTSVPVTVNWNVAAKTVGGGNTVQLEFDYAGRKATASFSLTLAHAYSGGKLTGSVHPHNP
jgi:hypothetical protein